MFGWFRRKKHIDPITGEKISNPVVIKSTGTIVDQKTALVNKVDFTLQKQPSKESIDGNEEVLESQVAVFGINSPIINQLIIRLQDKAYSEVAYNLGTNHIFHTV